MPILHPLKLNSNRPPKLEELYEPSFQWPYRCSTYIRAQNRKRAPSAVLTVLQVVSVYIAGEAVGAVSQIFIADRLGRIHFMQLMCVVVTIGVTIQTASVNIGMFLAGRGIAGAAVGSVLMLVVGETV